MFTKFLENEECMKVLSWFINHPDGEYMGSVVCLDCDNMPVGRFMAAVTVLEGVGFLIVNDFEEELMISLDKEANISRSLLEVKKIFDDIGYVEPTVSSALSYLYSNEYRKFVDKQVEQDMIDWEEILSICQNYKNIDLSNPFNKEIHDICVELEKNGEFDNFMNFVRIQVNNEK